jgi:hypothetical protein
MTETNVPFGVEQANAYFNARRIKRGKKKSTTHANTKGVSTKGRVARNLKGPAHVGQQTDGGSGSAGDANSDEEEDKKLVLPPRGEMLTVLKQADEREATRRAANHKYALPRFEQVITSLRLMCLFITSITCLALPTHSISRCGEVSFSRARICSFMASGPR